VFVDSQAMSPNQDPEEMVRRVDSGTIAVVPTSMFGMTFDAPALCAAIRRRNPNALILMDCCQCFDAGWRGESLASRGDAAVLAFGIGKPMTTLLGGALLTNREDVYAAVRSRRDATFVSRPRRSACFRWGYFLSSWLALSDPAVALTDWLENVDSPLHRYLLRLRAREEIGLPADNATFMTAMEAAIGRTQLQRVSDFIRRRAEIAAVYARELGDLAGVQLLEWPEGSSYAIYAARLSQPDTRQQVLASLRRHGVQGDTTLSYVVPGLECYRAVGYDAGPFPNAAAWARGVFNLPNHPTMTDTQVSRVVAAIRRALAGLPAPGGSPAAGEPCA
jgi:dTDP-4-amino-4,6-dideoxygalactose transaminase